MFYFVKVKVSNSSYHAWCIRYRPPTPPWVIGISVGAGILFLIIVLGVTIAVAVRLKRNRKRRLHGPSVNDRDNGRQDRVGRIEKRRQRHRRELGSTSEEGVDWNLASFGGRLSGQNSFNSRIHGTIERHTIDHLDGSGRARFEYDRRIGSVNSRISAGIGRRKISENGLINQDLYLSESATYVGGASHSNAPHFANDLFGYLVQMDQEITNTTPVPSETPEDNGE